MFSVALHELVIVYLAAHGTARRDQALEGASAKNKLQVGEPHGTALDNLQADFAEDWDHLVKVKTNVVE